MDYQLIPMGDVWSQGMFTVPAAVVSQYIRLASAWQLKALLVVLAHNGHCTSREIAQTIGVPESEVCDLMEFWVQEQVLLQNGQAAAAQEAPQPQKAPSTPEQPPEKEAEKKEEKPQHREAKVTPPDLSPAAVNEELRNNPALTELMRESEVVMGKSLSHVMKVSIIHMNQFYGLPAEVVMTMLQYYKTEKEKGKSINMSYLMKMAQNWSEEGIDSLQAAEEKLRDLERSDTLWNEIITLSGLRFRPPSQKQRAMVEGWAKDFSMEMIALACDVMKEHADKPGLPYVDSVLKNWKKKGYQTPQQVEQGEAAHKNAKKGAGAQHHEIESTYNLDDVEKNTMFNDDYDV